MGLGEFFLIAIVGFLAPMAVLGRVAAARHEPSTWALWGLLSWAGVLIGLLMMIASPRKPQPPKPGAF